MLIKSPFLEVLYAFLEESHKGVLVEVVGARLHQKVAVVIQQAVIWLGISAKLGDLEVGVLTTDGLLLLAIVA